MEERQAVSRLEMEAYFGPGGRLSSAFGFEHRRAGGARPRGDAGAGAATRARGRHRDASLAYLIPRRLRPESRTPVVISYTISSRNAPTRISPSSRRSSPNPGRAGERLAQLRVLPPVGRLRLGRPRRATRSRQSGRLGLKAKTEPSPTSVCCLPTSGTRSAREIVRRSRHPTCGAPPLCDGRRWPAHLVVVHHLP